MSTLLYRSGIGLIVLSLPVAMWLKSPWITFALAALGQGLVVISIRQQSWNGRNLRVGRPYGRRRHKGRRHLALHSH
ncbi:hypothetical protein KUV89_07395 [Marinobacter hydrocarbonoclasticus]|nr:hypothetical protein [Marinobacter nauticus]